MQGYCCQLLSEHEKVQLGTGKLKAKESKRLGLQTHMEKGTKQKKSRTRGRERRDEGAGTEREKKN